MERALLFAIAEDQRLNNYELMERRFMRDDNNPMLLSESSFVENFRLSKAQFSTLYQDLAPFLTTPQRCTAVRTEIKILASLQYFAYGGYQRSVGLNYNLGLAQQTVSDCLAEVTNAINRPEILYKYIRFPRTSAERQEVSRGFNDKFGFPGVLGCIDGTHIAIVRPGDNEDIYFNRKYYHSLNAMVVCDANMRILYCDASFGGASHDSHIWNMNPLKAEMVRLHQSGENYWLLGDSGYAQRPWMMTPILNAAPHTCEEHYTRKHVQTRNIVERCFSVLKSRFRCLLAHRVMHYERVKAGKIFNACVVLHNLCDPTFPVNGSEMGMDAEQQPPRVGQPQDVRDGGRTAIVERLWRSR